MNRKGNITQATRFTKTENLSFKNKSGIKHFTIFVMVTPPTKVPKKNKWVNGIFSLLKTYFEKCTIINERRKSDNGYVSGEKERVIFVAKQA